MCHQLALNVSTSTCNWSSSVGHTRTDVAVTASIQHGDGETHGVPKTGATVTGSTQFDIPWVNLQTCGLVSQVPVGI